MALYKSSSALTPEGLSQGFRELRPTGHGKLKIPAFKSNRDWCFDNGEADCSSLYLTKPRADYVRKSHAKAELAAQVAIVTGKIKAPICQNCFIPKHQCECA